MSVTAQTRRNLCILTCAAAGVSVYWVTSASKIHTRLDSKLRLLSALISQRRAIPNSNDGQVHVPFKSDSLLLTPFSH